MALFAVVIGFSLYFLLGPLLLLLAIRVFLWLGRAVDLPSALGVFGAETRRSFRAHANVLDREFGEHVGHRAD
jgi:hypothetical protein